MADLNNKRIDTQLRITQMTALLHNERAANARPAWIE
jgi:hypothetical protein